MSETNFTEQDRRWLERLEIPTGPSNSRTKEATTHAIAEIDSLRIDLVAVESNYDGQNAALTEILKLCGYNLPDGDTAGNYGDEVAVGEVRKVLAERESLRAQLEEAQGQRDMARADLLEAMLISGKHQREGDTLRSEVERLKTMIEDIAANTDDPTAMRRARAAVGAKAGPTREEILKVLEPIAAMDRPGCDLSELACERGVASDKTILTSRDFRAVATLCGRLVEGLQPETGGAA